MNEEAQVIEAVIEGMKYAIELGIRGIVTLKNIVALIFYKTSDWHDKRQDKKLANKKGSTRQKTMNKITNDVSFLTVGKEDLKFFEKNCKKLNVPYTALTELKDNKEYIHIMFPTSKAAQVHEIEKMIQNRHIASGKENKEPLCKKETIEEFIKDTGADKPDWLEKNFPDINKEIEKIREKLKKKEMMTSETQLSSLKELKLALFKKAKHQDFTDKLKRNDYSAISFQLNECVGIKRNQNKEVKSISFLIDNRFVMQVSPDNMMFREGKFHVVLRNETNIKITDISNNETRNYMFKDIAKMRKEYIDSKNPIQKQDNQKKIEKAKNVEPKERIVKKKEPTVWEKELALYKKRQEVKLALLKEAKSNDFTNQLKRDDYSAIHFELKDLKSVTYDENKRIKNVTFSIDDKFTMEVSTSNIMFKNGDFQVVLENAATVKIMNHSNNKTHEDKFENAVKINKNYLERKQIEKKALRLDFLQQTKSQNLTEKIKRNDFSTMVVQIKDCVDIKQNENKEIVSASFRIDKKHLMEVPANNVMLQNGALCIVMRKDENVKITNILHNKTKSYLFKEVVKAKRARSIKGLSGKENRNSPNKIQNSVPFAEREKVSNTEIKENTSHTEKQEDVFFFTEDKSVQDTLIEKDTTNQDKVQNGESSLEKEQVSDTIKEDKISSDEIQDFFFDEDKNTAMEKSRTGKDEKINPITIDESLIVKEKNGIIQTRVPKTWGDDVRYLILKKEMYEKIHHGKTVLAHLSKDKIYNLYDKNGQVASTITGEKIYQYYDRVAQESRKMNTAKNSNQSVTKKEALHTTKKQEGKQVQNRKVRR